MTRYTYGDSELARERLAIVADLFGPASGAFLRDSVPRRPGLAVDLGCGPGHTTRLVHEVTRAERTIGLDSSPGSVATASADAPVGVAFLEHDATVMQLPVAAAELIYVRLLLAHLPSPRRSSRHGAINSRSADACCSTRSSPSRPATP